MLTRVVVAHEWLKLPPLTRLAASNNTGVYVWLVTAAEAAAPQAVLG